MAKSWHRFDQYFLSFAVKHVREDANASCVPVWPCHRVHETRPEQIFCERKDRDRFSRLLSSAKCLLPAGNDDINPSFDQLRRILRNQIKV